MSCVIKSINYCPVKSLSFQSVNSCQIQKNLGILNDRIFAFSSGINTKNAELIEKNPKQRKLNNFLTLKNSPVLNKYNFNYDKNKLSLFLENREIISISPDNLEERPFLSEKLSNLEKSLAKPIQLLKNEIFPFYDTSHSDNIFNSLSLINLNSIKDFESKINREVEFERFRANFYVDGIEAWDEKNWINKIIRINNVSFKVEKNIPRCVAINLKPKTEESSFNMLQSLKNTYNDFDMGIYLIVLDSGNVNVGDKVKINN